MRSRKPNPLPRRPVRTGLREPFLIADFSSMVGMACPCGTSRRAFIRPDNRICSVHLVEIRADSRTHYHRGFTETYYVLEGDGHLELNGKDHLLHPGMAVMIRPGTRHRAIPGPKGLRILNIVVPPFDFRDEWED